MVNIVETAGQVEGKQILTITDELRPLRDLQVLSAFSGIPSETLTKHGTEGSAIKFDSEIGKTYQLRLKSKAPHSAFYFDEESFLPLTLSGINNYLTIRPEGDNWGIILLRKFPANTQRFVEVEVEELNPQPFPHSVYPIGGSVSINTLTQTYNLPTRGASIARLSNSLDKDLSTTGCLEGSGVVFSVPNGRYSFELDASAANESDELFAWNGYELKSLWRFGQPTQLSADAVYGYIAFAALDQIAKDEPSNFIIKNLVRTSDINYLVPEIISLVPNVKQGSVANYDKFVRIGTGAGSLPCDDTFPLTLPLGLANAVEGSFAEWTGLDDGQYLIDYHIRTTESVVEQDIIYWYDGDNTLTELTTRQVANIPNREEEPSRWDSPRRQITLDVTGGKLGFAAIDTETKTGTTELRIISIKKNIQP